MQENLTEWGKNIETVTLPRWDELPDIELYMDQVIGLVGRYLSPILTTQKQALLTKSMVNNYVKLELIPAPVKKKYTRVHLAFLIAITLLKQVLTIPEIKTGIIYQGRASGIQKAYNIFCETQENTISIVGKQAQGLETKGLFTQKIELEYLIVTAACTSLATKLLAEKSIELTENLSIAKEEDTHEL
ncbi:hypothetical protein Hs30E_16600 [Lactococcus hodotermopsidis]|uniref:Fatty acid-binding protein DegV n=1 Tax=Pseudolactococcus hodotermopsidis TaxID=2709157 RepID=A0A6A0BCG9_9LACT|nr:DUF1836 domain-containing protein [Lactococcus hodotermopsidis]GFH43109.1 hypothetical protein Hs30E_16600 [Lactococcus hodotermopsidis]